MSATRLRHEITLDNMRLKFETSKHLLVSTMLWLFDIEQGGCLPAPTIQSECERRLLRVGLLERRWCRRSPQGNPKICRIFHKICVARPTLHPLTLGPSVRKERTPIGSGKSFPPNDSCSSFRFNTPRPPSLIRDKKSQRPGFPPCPPHLLIETSEEDEPETGTVTRTGARTGTRAIIPFVG